MPYEAGWCNKTWAIKAKEAAPNEVRHPLNTNPVFHCHGGKNMFQKSDHCHPVMLQAWKNPYVELYHNRAKIAHLPLLPPIFFCKFYFSHSYLFIKAYHDPKLETNPLSESWYTGFHNFGAQLGQNRPHGSKKIFLEEGEFHCSDIYLLIVPYHAPKFEKKILRADPEIIAFIILDHNRVIIAHLTK